MAKTFNEILEQYSRICSNSEQQSRRDRAYYAYCIYRDNIIYSDKYMNIYKHVIKCINGNFAASNRQYLYPEIGELSENEKKNLAGRIADTIVKFTREEYTNTYIQHFDND